MVQTHGWCTCAPLLKGFLEPIQGWHCAKQALTCMVITCCWAPRLAGNNHDAFPVKSVFLRFVRLQEYIDIVQ